MPAISAATAMVHATVFIVASSARRLQNSKPAKRSAEARSAVILDSLLAANLAANFSHWVRIRSHPALIRAAIPERWGEFPARRGREFVWPRRAIFHGRQGILRGGRELHQLPVIGAKLVPGRSVIAGLVSAISSRGAQRADYRDGSGQTRPWSIDQSHNIEGARTSARCRGDPCGRPVWARSG